MLPRGGSLLEIGEANWYGDVNTLDILNNLEGEDRLTLTDAKVAKDLFAIAKHFYKSLFAPAIIVSVDMHGNKDALRFDLNQPISLDRQFDVVINHGTAEHIFNVGQVFKTMHDRCDLNGVMIHDAPFKGWIDHGFYCFQPTLFYDLAMANCYEIAYVAVYEIKSGLIIRVDSREHVPDVSAKAPDNCNLFVVFRKRIEQEFRLPMQGYYAGSISDQAKQVWEVNR